MEQYRVLKKSFLNKGLREEGEIVSLDIDYDPKKHTNIEPVDGKKVKRKPKTTGKPGLVAEGDEDLVDTNKDNDVREDGDKGDLA